MFSMYRGVPVPARDIKEIMNSVLSNIVEKEGLCIVTIASKVLTPSDVHALKKWLTEKEIRFEDKSSSYLEFPYTKAQLTEQFNETIEVPVHTSMSLK